MSGKTRQQAQELHHQVEAADLAANQADRQQLLQAEEEYRVSGYTENRDLANQLVGRIQMAQGIAKLATVASLSDLAYIKENKLYQSLAGKKITTPDGGELATVATWEGFCEALGYSRRKIDEQLQNLREFGEEALDAMTRAGIGYRSLRKLRKLPDDDRQMVINGEAVRLGDKEAIEDLIERLDERHARERQALERRADDLAADLDASRKVIQKRAEKIDELERLIHRRESLGTDDLARDLSEKLDQGVRDAIQSLHVPSRVIGEVLGWEDAPRELRHSCAQGVARIRIALDRLQQQYSLPTVDLDIDDSWIQNATGAEAE
ncbi:MAG: hypothetical protein OQL11_07700 [Gammaproteobacteria bacterium]|nr:hypothetical protein [Gammaproteobacteria bacterium]